jgi:hypothetical protein
MKTFPFRCALAGSPDPFFATESTKSQTRVHGVLPSEPSGLCELGSELRLGSVTNPKNNPIQPAGFLSLLSCLRPSSDAFAP